ncbi:MAG: amidoligase family protein [Bdellovibrionales bacterium]
MQRFIVRVLFSVFFSVVSLMGQMSPALATTPEEQFIENLKAIYLTDAAKENGRTGFEVELNGLTEVKILQLVQEHFGGKIEGEYVRGTLIGDIRVYYDGSMWRYQDWAMVQNGGRENKLRRAIQAIFDALGSPVEIVFPPVKYSEIPLLEEFIAKLNDAGATGTKGLSAAAIHTNTQIDPQNATLLRNLLGLYTNNGSLLRSYFKPLLIRRLRGFIQQPTPEMAAQLADWTYRPTAPEFWLDFRKGVQPKLSAFNITPAFVMNSQIPQDNIQELVSSGWIKPRPASEIRETNSRTEVGYLTNLAEVGLALAEAAKETGHLTPQDLTAMVALKKQGGININTEAKSIATKPFDHSLRQVLDPSNYVLIPLKPIPSVNVSFINQGALAALGITGTQADFLARHANEAIRPEEIRKMNLKEYKGENVLALAYNDGYLGRGDGRANWLYEVEIPGVGVYDVGEKGIGPTEYVIPQESIDKGYHVAEKDGYLSLGEAFRTILVGTFLDSVGIESERVLANIETGRTTGHNLKPAPGQDPNELIEPTSKILRVFPGGLRGAHLRMYSPDQLQRVSYWLRQREAIRLGQPKTNPPPLALYLKNKIQRDALRAAVAQHFWVVHGAINVANITENGWADINYARPLAVPDGKHTPLNVYSRLEYQSQEFAKVTKQFVDTIKQVDPSLTIDVQTEFQRAYEAELTRLELIQAGFSESQAALLVRTQATMATRYKNLVWDINYNHLNTDTRQLKANIARKLWNAGGVASQLSTQLSTIKNESLRLGDHRPERVFVEEMFPADRWKYRLSQFWKSLISRKGPVAIVPEAKIQQMAELTQLFAEVVAREQQTNSTDVLKLMARRSTAATKLRFISPEAIDALYNNYRRSGSKDLNAFLELPLRQIQSTKQQIRVIYGETSPSQRVKTAYSAMDKSLIQEKRAEEKTLTRRMTCGNVL